MTPPPFTVLQEKVFDIVTNIMGYDATWTPVDGGSVLSGKVCFKDPHSDLELAGFQFTPKTKIAEWKAGDFAGLETAFNSGLERLVIEGHQYSVIHVKSLWDGKTYQAVMEQITGD